MCRYKSYLKIDGRGIGRNSSVLLKITSGYG